ncbi:MAG: hypothetical protein Q7V63_06205 [Gammaproteobacteria bacterium]|nr:hypothetical protein [Gammaproteobacteria bacterium]
MSHGVPKHKFDNHFQLLNELSIFPLIETVVPEAISIPAEELAHSTNPYIKFIFKPTEIDLGKRGLIAPLSETPLDEVKLKSFLDDAIARPMVKINGVYFIDLLRAYCREKFGTAPESEELLTLSLAHVHASLAECLGVENAAIVLNSWHQIFINVSSQFLFTHAIMGMPAPITPFPNPARCVSVNLFVDHGKLIAHSVSHMMGFLDSRVDLDPTLQEYFPLYGKVNATMEYRPELKGFVFRGYHIQGQHRAELKEILMNEAGLGLATLWQAHRKMLPLQDYKAARMEAVKAIVVDVSRSEGKEGDFSSHVLRGLLSILSQDYFRLDLAGEALVEAYAECCTKIALFGATSPRTEGQGLYTEIMTHYCKHLPVSLAIMCAQTPTHSIKRELTARLLLLKHLKYLAEGEETSQLFVKACAINCRSSTSSNRSIMEFLNFGLLACSLTELANSIVNASRHRMWLKYDSLDEPFFSYFYQWYYFLHLATSILWDKPHDILDLFYCIVLKLRDSPSELIAVENKGFLFGLILSAWQFKVEDLVSWPKYSAFHDVVKAVVQEYESTIFEAEEAITWTSGKRRVIRSVFSIIYDQLKKRTHIALKEFHGADLKSSYIYPLNLLFDPHYLLWLERLEHRGSQTVPIEYINIAELSVSRRLEPFTSTKGNIFYRGGAPANYLESETVMEGLIVSRARSEKAEDAAKVRESFGAYSSATLVRGMAPSAGAGSSFDST